MGNICCNRPDDKTWTKDCPLDPIFKKYKGQVIPGEWCSHSGKYVYIHMTREVKILVEKLYEKKAAYVFRNSGMCGDSGLDYYNSRNFYEAIQSGGSFACHVPLEYELELIEAAKRDEENHRKKVREIRRQEDFAALEILHEQIEGKQN